jgi:acetyl-CoA carboxylase biotin carboxyl carrier protein
MLTHEDVEDILRLLDATPVDEFELQTEHFKLTLRRAPAGHGGWTQERHTRAVPDMLAAEAVSAGPVSIESTAAAAAATATAATAAATAATTASAATAATAAAAAPPSGQLEIRAPLVGSFYRAPQPGAAPFVDVGTLVTPDTVVAIIETMKLMTSVNAGAAGRVVDICIADGGLVEQHQVLMRLAALGS